jgi:DNA-directed RNA polymerase subunit RPC12/RpoP
MLNREICCQCGRSVKIGSGRFVNRVLSFDNDGIYDTIGIPFPDGKYTCAECMQEYDNNGVLNQEIQTKGIIL